MVHQLLEVLTGSAVPYHSLVDTSTQKLLSESNAGTTQNICTTGCGISNELSSNALRLPLQLLSEATGNPRGSGKSQMLGIIQSLHLYSGGCKSQSVVRPLQVLQIGVQCHLLNLLHRNTGRQQSILYGSGLQERGSATFMVLRPLRSTL